MTRIRGRQEGRDGSLHPGTKPIVGLFLVLGVSFGLSPSPAASSSLGAGASIGTVAHDEPGKGTADTAFGRLPVRFEANVGQTDAQVEYLVRGTGYTVFLTRTEAVLSLSRRRAGAGGTEANGGATADVVRLSMAGGNGHPELVGLDRLAGHSNYYGSSDPSQWHEGVPTYGSVAYRNAYPGIDLVYHGDDGQVKFDFAVAPGADPDVISVDVDGGELSLDGRDLVITTAGGQLRKPEPLVYQERNGMRQTVPASYVLQGDGRFGFELGSYDPAHPLVVDPALAYSATLQGEDPYRLDVDGQGNAYVHGVTTSATFPGNSATTGEPQVFVAKMSADGAGLAYTSFLGSAGPVNAPGRLRIHGLDIDRAGNAYVGGDTLDDFPLVGGGSARDPAAPCSPTSSTCNRDAGSYFDGFLARLRPDGQLSYFTYLRDHMLVRDIAVDQAGDDVDVHIIGETHNRGLVTTANAIESSPPIHYSARNLGFVARVQPGVQGNDFYGYLSYFGRRLGMTAVAVDADRKTYLVGTLNWSDFTNTSNPFGGTADTLAYVPISAGAYQTSRAYYNGQVPFASKLDTHAPTTSLVYSSYLGGGGGQPLDFNCPGPGLAGGCQGAMGVAAHGGNMYVTGFSAAKDFPTTPTALQPINFGTFTGFVSQIDPGQSGLTSLVYSTFLGGEADDRASGIVVDGDGLVTVTGLTASGSFPISDPLPGQDTFRGGGTDGFVTTLDPRQAGPLGLVRSTFLGGSEGDHGRSVALDGRGGIYVRGVTTSGDFPVTPGAFPQGGGGAFVSKVTPEPVLPCEVALGSSTDPTSISPAGAGPTLAGMVGFGLLDGGLGLSAWATAAVERRRRRQPRRPRAGPPRPPRRGRGGEGGLTLVELLVVVAILGILSAVVVFAVRGSDDKGRRAAVQTDERVIRTALEVFCAQNSRYPNDIGELVPQHLDGPSEYHTLYTGPPFPASTSAIPEEGNCTDGNAATPDKYKLVPVPTAPDPCP